MGCILYKSSTYVAECSRKVAIERRLTGTIKSLELECARALNEKLLVPVLLYGTETNDMEGER